MPNVKKKTVPLLPPSVDLVAAVAAAANKGGSDDGDGGDGPAVYYLKATGELFSDYPYVASRASSSFPCLVLRRRLAHASHILEPHCTANQSTDLIHLAPFCCIVDMINSFHIHLLSALSFHSVSRLITSPHRIAALTPVIPVTSYARRSPIVATALTPNAFLTSPARSSSAKQLVKPTSATSQHWHRSERRRGSFESASRQSSRPGC